MEFVSFNKAFTPSNPDSWNRVTNTSSLKEEIKNAYNGATA
jgi:hypothetical protein